MGEELDAIEQEALRLLAELWDLIEAFEEQLGVDR